MLKKCLSSRGQQVLMKLGDFLGKNAKIGEILTKSSIFLLYVTKFWFLITHCADFPSRMKQGSWKLVHWYFYMVSKNLWNRILKFWFILILLIMSKISDILPILCKTLAPVLWPNLIEAAAQNYTCADFFKSEARKLKFGIVVPLYHSF